MKLWIVPILAITLAIGIADHAEARNFRIGLVGSYGITNIEQSTGSGTLSTSVGPTDKSHNIGAGMLIEFGLWGPLGLEVGTFYQPRGFREETSADEVKYNTNMSVAMLRFDFGESVGNKQLPISLGLGAYYSESLDGQVTAIDGSTKASTQKDFTDSTLPLGAMGKIDRGLIASLATDYPISKNFLFTFDLRYLYGLTDVVNPTTSVTGNWAEFSTLVGLILRL